MRQNFDDRYLPVSLEDFIAPDPSKQQIKDVGKCYELGIWNAAVLVWLQSIRYPRIPDRGGIAQIADVLHRQFINWKHRGDSEPHDPYRVRAQKAARELRLVIPELVRNSGLRAEQISDPLDTDKLTRVYGKPLRMQVSTDFRQKSVGLRCGMHRLSRSPRCSRRSLAISDVGRNIPVCALSGRPFGRWASPTWSLGLSRSCWSGLVRRAAPLRT